MKRGKESRDRSGRPAESNDAREIPVLMLVMEEQAPGTIKLRFVSNDDLISDLRAQGALPGFLQDVDQLYSEFRGRFMRTRSLRVPIRGSLSQMDKLRAL
jgi:hypothetical protein